MNKIEIRTTIVKGKFKRNLPLILEAVESFEGKDVIFTLQRATKKRSNPQNAYYWGVIIPIARQAIRDAWGEVWNNDKTHEFFKMHFLYHEKHNEQTGEVVKIPKSTTENTTTAQEDYHSEIRMFLKEWFNVECPLPNEDITLEFN